MKIPDKICTEIYTNIPMHKDMVNNILHELIDGNSDTSTPSIIKPGWHEFDEVYLDHNDDYDESKAKKYPSDKEAFVFFRYIIEIDPKLGTSKKNFDKAVFKLKNLLSAKGFNAVVVDE